MTLKVVVRILDDSQYPVVLVEETCRIGFREDHLSCLENNRFRMNAILAKPKE